MPQNNFNIERRTTSAEIQPVNIKPLEGIIEGYAIVFEKMTPIGNLFYEIIDRHALDEADLSDVKFLINHDDMMIPVARHRRGSRSTMDLEIDDIGLKNCARVDLENNANAKMLCSAVERGDVTDMSFAFGILVEGEEWSNLGEDMPLRRITKIKKVFEISAVNDGAYSQTSISVRSASLDNEKKALDNARAVALDNEKRTEEKRQQAALMLEKEKFILLEEQKNVKTRRIV